jgi:hypothetical protein
MWGVARRGERKKKRGNVQHESPRSAQAEPLERMALVQATHISFAISIFALTSVDTSSPVHFAASASATSPVRGASPGAWYGCLLSSLTSAFAVAASFCVRRNARR